MKEAAQTNDIVKISASNPVRTDCEFSRIVVRPVSIKGKACFQAEMFKGAQAFHQNISPEELSDWIASYVQGVYKQTLFVMTDREVTYLTSSKGKVTRLEKPAAHEAVRDGNDRQKKYILNVGKPVPALADLGVFTQDGKVVAGMYDKFKQINRFVEILDDVFKSHTGKLTVLDFGCSKSYLTFVVYYYLTELRHIDAQIIGYDVKKDVVANCNALAAKYGYRNLRFEAADVSKDKLSDEHIDAVISLHACDTATDYALHYAVRHNVKYIFSVPCCQHEVNNSISAGQGDLDVLLRYGIVKERVSALLTDAIRAMTLEDEGYKVDVMEFVDLAHSPKNIMLRCVKTGKTSRKNAAAIRSLLEKYGFHQTLFELLNK